MGTKFLLCDRQAYPTPWRTFPPHLRQTSGLTGNCPYPENSEDDPRRCSFEKTHSISSRPVASPRLASPGTVAVTLHLASLTISKQRWQPRCNCVFIAKIMPSKFVPVGTSACPIIIYDTFYITVLIHKDALHLVHVYG